MLRKKIVLRIKNVYTANAFVSGSRTLVGGGSETESVVQLYDLESGQVEDLGMCPGGMMSLVPVPGKPQQLASVMGLFPPFLGKNAGLFLHQKQDDAWTTTRIMDLPFAHRCEFLPNSKKKFLIAASVSKYKENPPDWSRPGEIYAIDLDSEQSEEWTFELIDSALYRNHGMGRYWIDGMEYLCVSGDRGIFTLERGAGGAFGLKPLFEKEVSELTFVDLDGDGESELITIEPFHGDGLNIYKRVKGDWKLKFSAPLSFGHGLSGGLFNGAPVVLTGNRSGSMELQMYTIGNLDKGIVSKNVIEKGVGPTQTQVFSYNNKDYILSSNQRKNEVALYSTS